MISLDLENIDRSTSEYWFEEGPVIGSPIRMFRDKTGAVLVDYRKAYSVVHVAVLIGFLAIWLGAVWGAAAMAIGNNVASVRTAYLCAGGATCFALMVVLVMLVVEEWRRRRNASIPPILRCAQKDGAWLASVQGQEVIEFDRFVLIEGRTQKTPLFENNSLLFPAPYAHLLLNCGDETRLLVSFVRPMRQQQKAIIAGCKEFGIPISVHSILTEHRLQEHLVRNRNSQWQVWR